MRSNKLFYIGFFSLIITTFFVSCSKNDENVLPKESPIVFSKEIEVFDLNKECSAIMKISSEDASLLNFYTEKNFKIIPVKEGQPFEEAVDSYYKVNPMPEEETEDDEDGDAANIIENSAGPTVNITKIREKLVEGVKFLAITSISPDFGDVRGWNISTYWDFTGSLYCDFKRTSWVNNVYYGIAYNSQPYVWLVEYPQWAKNNTLYSYPQPTEFFEWWDLKVKYRKTRNFTYSFHN